jgi:DNA helicase IV
MADAAELVREQKYFDNALDHREKRRERLRHAAVAGADKKAAAALRLSAEDAIDELHGPAEAVAFGRIDLEQSETFYIGYNGILNDDKDALVVNWAAPVAGPFYRASYADSAGVLVKRTYTCESNTILDLDDVVFAELLADVERLQEGETLPFRDDDPLLQDLARKRSGEMEDIVRTIQAAQYEIMRADMDQLLVVQGGPGTGKTAIALHRIAWLLFNHRDRLAPADMLVIGPNPTFIRYVKGVLPSLGDQDIRHADVAALFGGVRVEREEHPDVARLKGETRIRGLIDRGLRDRVRVPEERLELEIGTQVITFGRPDLEVQIERLTGLRYALGRQQFREFIRDRLGGGTDRDGQVEALVERVWPQLSPQAFLQDLLGSEGRLLLAGGEDFTAAEIRLLYRRAAERLADEVWSRADVPLLDYVDDRMNGAPAKRYAHIVVDEAQDLSPMELMMIARRSHEGSMSILGDLAQSTGVWARDSWDGVIEHLRSDLPVSSVELKYGYRVPRQIFEFAAHLLPYAAPGLTAPQVIRDGPEEPTFTQTNWADLGDAAVDAALAYLQRGYKVGLICPTPHMAEVTSAFDLRDVAWSDARREGITGPISVLTPSDARGLEFDAVVVVEPESIVQEELRGERLLYVALTRSTRYLTVVHVGSLLPLPEIPYAFPKNGQSSEGSRDNPPRGPSSREVRAAKALASVLADEIRDSFEPGIWEAVMTEIASQLSGSIDDNI